MLTLDDAALRCKHFPSNIPPELAPAVGESDQFSIQTIAFMRRRLPDRRFALEEHWRDLFPHHDFATLRLIRRPPAWDDDAWARAARAYHQDRKRGVR
jgi:hypothetical protein